MFDFCRPAGRRHARVPQARCDVAKRQVATSDGHRIGADVFRENMYDGDFVFSVTREAVRACPVPLLVHEFDIFATMRFSAFRAVAALASAIAARNFLDDERCQASTTLRAKWRPRSSP